MNEDRSPIKEEPIEGSKKLFIIFGGINAGAGMPQFEFCNAAKILKDSRVFVRDFSQTWYHCGLVGKTSDIKSTVSLLETIIAKYPEQEVVMVGNSMGGYAAILFASMIPGSRAIVFSPQTFIGPIRRIQMGEGRWKKETFLTYLKGFLKSKYYDLRDITEHNQNWHADIIVSRDHSRDMKHARNISVSPQVTIHEYKCDRHRLVKVLRDKGVLSDILQKNDFSSKDWIEEYRPKKH